jgi:hypothetical protein
VIRAAALAGLVWAASTAAQAQTAQETVDAAVRGALWCVAKAEEAFQPLPEPATVDEMLARGPEGFQLVFGQMSMTWMYHPMPAGDDAAVMIFAIPGQCGGQSLDVGDVRQAVEAGFEGAGFAPVMVDAPNGGEVQVWRRRSDLGGVYAGVLPDEERTDRMNFFAVEESVFLEGLAASETGTELPEGEASAD